MLLSSRLGQKTRMPLKSRSRRLEARWTALPKMENHFKFVSRDLLLHQTQLSYLGRVCFLFTPTRNTCIITLSKVLKGVVAPNTLNGNLWLSEYGTFLLLLTSAAPQPPCMICITNSPDPLEGSCRPPPNDNSAALLPSEILDNIYEDLYQSDLACLAKQSRIDPLCCNLPRTSSGSFEQLHNIAENLTLNSFVRYLHYDAQQLGIDCEATYIDLYAVLNSIFPILLN